MADEVAGQKTSALSRGLLLYRSRAPVSIRFTAYFFRATSAENMAEDMIGARWLSHKFFCCFNSGVLAYMDHLCLFAAGWNS